MFYNNFIELCKKKGVSASVVLENIGLNRSNATYWKNGSAPKSSTVQKLAVYFGVSADYLIQGEQKSEYDHYDNLNDLYYHSIKVWSEDVHFTERDSAAIKMHVSDLLSRYKMLLEGLLQCKFSLQRYLDSISTFNNQCEHPLSTQELTQQYISQTIKKNLDDLNACIAAAPHHFSIALSADVDEQASSEGSGHL